MNVIEFERAKKEKEKKKLMVKIPVVEKIYMKNGELKFVVSGKQEIFKTWSEAEYN
ncbi:hypothetical protein BC30048_p2015 (plasmid) [Bacillus cereus]|uniref:hypothetical protein n=1 Tax=Bacillus cereus group TaxID=86661 RepID=UPI001F3770D4|nr:MULTISPECIES: hypothetical protein [Bacillus cereus group]BCD02840.1 hypothetical protein BC30048_p2015 [Bacillus cereus]